jgi:hypothetical protein
LAGVSKVRSRSGRRIGRLVRRRVCRRDFPRHPAPWSLT